MRGGFLHNEVLAEKVARVLVRAGAIVRREVFVQQGSFQGSVDVTAQWGRTLLAVEIELSPRRVARDVKKARVLGATTLWIVAPTASTRHTHQRALRRLSRMERKSLPIYVLLLAQIPQALTNYLRLMAGSNDRLINTQSNAWCKQNPTPPPVATLA